MRSTINILIAVSLPSWWEEMAIRRYRAFAAPDVEVMGAAFTAQQQACASTSGPLMPLVEMGKRAECAGAAVHILDCFGDPQLEELRGRLQQPVVGVGQSAMMAASVWFSRFAVITSERATRDEITSHADRYGVLSHLTDCRAIEMAAADIPDAREEALRRTVLHARELSGTECEAVLLGCTELAMLAPFLEQALRHEGRQMSVVNPIAVAQKWAEMTLSGRLHRLHLT